MASLDREERRHVAVREDLLDLGEVGPIFGLVVPAHLYQLRPELGRVGRNLRPFWQGAQRRDAQKQVQHERTRFTATGKAATYRLV